MTEEEHLARMCTQAWADVLESAPRNYTFIVNTHGNFAVPSTLTEDQVDAAFRVIDEYTPVEPRVELFGGEPLLPGTENVIDHLLGRLAERGGQATLQTNGFHLQHRLDLLERYRDLPLRVNVRTNVDRANVGRLGELAAFFAERGCPPPAFRPRANYCEAVALKLFVFHPDDHVYPCPEIAGTPAYALGAYRPWLRLDQTQVARWRRQTVLDRHHDAPGL